MEFRTAQGRHRYDALLGVAAETVVGLDFDGVLSPIVDDPTRAVIHPEGPDVLVGLAARVRAIAVITGRPAAQAVELGRLAEIGATIEPDRELFVLGQYGNERWSSRTGEVVSPSPPEGLAGLVSELPGLLEETGAADAFVEEKGLAVAVHTRRLPEPQAAFDRLLPALAHAAERHGLGIEPGRLVVEVRAPGKHKGDAVRTVAAELSAGGFLFAGDDLGDVEAFRAVARLREDGMPALLVCSGSVEQQALVELSDIVVDGPAGVMDLLRTFTRDAAGGSGRAG